MHEREPLPEEHVPAPAPQVASAPPARSSRTTVQAKLTVGAAGDRFEQEADTVAAAVMRRLQQHGSNPGLDGDDGKVARMVIAAPFADDLAPESSRVSTGSLARQIQRASGETIGAAGGTVDDDTDRAINQAKGSGKALDTGLRRSMESGFGADFSNVRVHHDNRSNKLNQRIQAKAFTTGSDIFFRQGEYSPGSASGQELVAHELTHVVQQGGAVARRVQRRISADTAAPIRRAIGDLGQGAAKTKATAYPSESQAREYMDSLGGTKAGNQWRELKKIAAGRNLSDSITLLAHYAWGLSQPVPADEAELPAFKAQQETWKTYMKPAAEKIGLVLKQKNLYAFRTGAETDIAANRAMVTKGAKSEAKNFYFWSMTMKEADAESQQQQGTTLEASAAGSMWVGRAFADPGDDWCGAPGRLDRIIFEAMSGHYAKTAEEVIHGNKAASPDDGSVIKILQYRGINKDTAFYTEEWAKVRDSGLPYQFAVYLFSGSPTAAGWPAGGVFQSPEFKDVKMYDKGIAEHYTMPVGAKGTETPPVWDFQDKTDPFLSSGGVHVNGKGPEEPGHMKSTRAYAEIPAAFLGNKMVGKDLDGKIYLMNLDGSKGAFYADDEAAAIALNAAGGNP